MFPTEHAAVNVRAAHRRVSRVLVIESDSAQRAALGAALTEAGHEAESAASAESGLALARAARPDIVLFDLMQPDIPGLDLCRLLRAELRASLCVLTAAADEPTRVSAFEAGVDDYVTKPYSMRELLLRVRALSRRRRSAGGTSEEIAIGALRIDRAARRVDVGGVPIALTRREFDLLLHLADRAGRVQTRETLVADIWGELTDSGRVVDTTVKRLRRKLGPTAPPIRTVRGVGYKLHVEERVSRR